MQELSMVLFSHCIFNHYLVILRNKRCYLSEDGMANYRCHPCQLKMFNIEKVQDNGLKKKLETKILELNIPIRQKKNKEFFFYNPKYALSLNISQIVNKVLKKKKKDESIKMLVILLYF